MDSVRIFLLGARTCGAAQKKLLGPEGAERLDPFRVGQRKGALSVGGGHQKRALYPRLLDFNPCGVPKASAGTQSVPVFP